MNKQNLKGMRCPKCGSEEPFRIDVAATVLAYDTHIDDLETLWSGADMWCEDDQCECLACEYVGTVKKFRVKRRKQ